jgi:recombinational DNA repair ATPase RecF
VVRESESGNVYEDEIENLSESEKEVAGLVFALSGYLAHEVYEYLPFMLIDSMGALDSERVEQLLDYFDDHVQYLVAAVLPEVLEDLDSENGYNVVKTL